MTAELTTAMRKGRRGIVTDVYGNRHRYNPALPCHRCDDPSQPTHSARTCRKSDQLPRVPTWTLPSLAPQYLTDDPLTTLKRGDVVLIAARIDNGWMRLTHKTLGPDDVEGGLTLDGVSPKDGTLVGRWLLRRKDLEEDV